ncbi:metallophosphoesterase [Actinoplanes sp. NBRC 101535]|uniref:metallophosphoesterase n=1 Tax=Actinoplanes sp. NBRC 101535 TaxID=3032196 RepID=UPI0024A2F101|nr:metallophosphoesterase [Actinoplanes sp. NBRC 101535]GLY07942.1 membrane protein [Actinoplanes sp. NBRC 101535]
MIIVLLLALVALAVLGSGHWYLWRRLIRDTTPAGSGLRRAGTALFAAGPLLAVGALMGEQLAVPLLVKRVLAWPGYLWLALFLYLFLAVLAGEVIRPLLTWWLERRATTRPASSPTPAAVAPASAALASTGPHAEAEATPPAGAQPTTPPETPLATLPETPSAIPSATPPETPLGIPSATVPATPPAPPVLSRRVFVSRVVGGAAAAVAVGTVGAGAYGVLNGPSVKRLTVPLARLPRAAHGLRIAVVSDVHLGPVLGAGFCRRVVDTINGTQPDLIAVVGDLIDGDVETLAGSVEPLRGLQSRLGTFFVTGNHEYHSGVEPWVAKVRELGMQPLRNTRAELPYLDLAGVDDVAGESDGGGPDFAAALDDRDPSRALVLLAHQPVVIHDAVTHGVDLQLSGHTHGGQLWPGNYIAAAANPTNAGLEAYGDTQLYVSRGAGAWGPPVRVGAPSDITVVELASRQA